MSLTERQLEIMRVNYPGFKKFDADVRYTKVDEKKYREYPGYVPHPDGAPQNDMAGKER